MEFVRLTSQVLMKLKMQGYNILRSNSPLTDENPTWIPERVDMEKFFDLDSDQLGKYTVPMDEKWLLVIDEGLKEHNEDLFGDVMIEA